MLSIFAPGVASKILDVMKSLLLKPSGSIASAMLTENRVTVNGLCVLLNTSVIGGHPGSPSMIE